MDQLKVFWKYVVKYHFWILTSVVLLTSLFVFSVSRAALDQQVSSRYGKLDSDFNTVSKLENDSRTHPNSNTETAVNKKLEAIRINVFEAWTKQYERQVPILRWSSDIFDKDSDAVKIVDKFRPIELFLPYPPPPDQGPLLLGDRQVYRDYVKTEFTELAKIVGAQWQATLGNARSSADDVASTSAAATMRAPLVLWSEASQSALQKSVAPWWDEFKVPSTLEICYTQEDIWILSAILKVIQATNGQAKENFQAPIKEILSIKMGKQASEGSIISTAAPGGEGSGLEGGGGGEGAATGIPDPADFRYVDATYKPVSGADLRGRMVSTSPEDAFFAVAKRVPIRLRVRMDQAKIAKLLAESGNGDMMIEVKQVRVNAGDQPMALDLSEMVSADDGEGGGGGFGGGSFGGGSTQSRSASGLSGGAVLDPDAPVEIYGIVFLFNPPHKEKLGFAVEAPAVPEGATP